jgi:hypothetical protein
MTTLNFDPLSTALSNLDPSAQKLHQILADRQPQAQPGMAPASGAVELPELLESRRDLGHRHAYARVRDDESRPFLRPVDDGQLDFAVVGKFNRVAKNVAEYASKFFPVGANRGM